TKPLSSRSGIFLRPVRGARASRAVSLRSGGRVTATHPQTNFGLRRNASGVANSPGLNFDQRPVSASRNVATPLSAERPDPVSAVSFRAVRTVSNSLAGKARPVAWRGWFAVAGVDQALHESFLASRTER